MHRHLKQRGFFLIVRREGEDSDSFKWEIHRRRKPFGIRLFEGGFNSTGAARAAGTKALAELLEQIRKEEASDR
jgi:hypothetical protein